MKVNDPSVTSAGTVDVTGALGVRGASRASGNNGGSSATNGAAHGASDDDVHLSELVRSLRSLAVDSPDRQANLEQIARTYASGNYQVNAPATASGIVDDALQAA
jgi:anti-sigma28 factor (negative regulator of flagellin synthesis)